MYAIILTQFRGNVNRKCRSELPLKPQKPRPLEGQLPAVALSEQAELGPRNVKLHAVAALHLKGDVVGSGVTIAMVGTVVPLADHLGGNGDAGGVVVVALTADVGHDDEDEHRKEQAEEQQENDGKNVEHQALLMSHNEGLKNSGKDNRYSISQIII